MKSPHWRGWLSICPLGIREVPVVCINGSASKRVEFRENVGAFPRDKENCPLYSEGVRKEGLTVLFR